VSIQFHGANERNYLICIEYIIFIYMDEDEDYLSSLSTNNRRNVSRQVDEYMEAIRKLPEYVRAYTGAF
jgi:hypothetical protein